MEIEFEQQFEAIDDAELARFETRHGFRFPADYREFMLKFNGGVPVNNRFVSKYLGPWQTFVVRRILPLADDGDAGYPNLEAVFAILEGRVPKNMVSVASDGFGSYFLIVFSGMDLGKVMFWEHEGEPDPDDTPADAPLNVTLVADSFTEFLQALRPED